jgi:outer membrane protein assembly factor BamC
MIGTNRIWLVLLLAMGIGACGTMDDILPDRKVDYKKQKVADNDLEIPPDLTRDTIGDTMPVPGTGETLSASYSEFEERKRGGRRGQAAGSGSEVLPNVENVEILRDGAQRWLNVQGDPEDIWPRVVAFWRSNGILLVEQDPAIGVMKTDWIENRADVKSDFVTDLFRKALDSVYSSGTRDQFRVRLEPAKTGSTDIYLTHRGLEEVFQRNAGGDTESSYWKSRPNDPGLEAEMLRRLMIYLGVAEERAERALAREETTREARTEMVRKRDGSATLVVKDYFASSWRLVGVALERVGFAVEDRDRTAGVYYVRYEDPTKEKDEGFMSKLAFWRDEGEFDAEAQYRVTLEDASDTTRVQVLDSEGKMEDTGTGTRILTLIQEHIR